MKELSGSITMSEASTLDASFRVLWTGTHDTSALDRLVTLVDELDPSTLGRPMALHAGGDRIVSLSVRPQDAHSLLGHSAEVRPSVVTMPAQSAANERLLIGSADAVILTDGGPLVDDAAAARKLDAILEALTARRRRPDSMPVLIDLPNGSTRTRAFWLQAGASWGDGLQVIESQGSSSAAVFQACWKAICAAAQPPFIGHAVPVPPLLQADIDRLISCAPRSLFRRAWDWLMGWVT